MYQSRILPYWKATRLQLTKEPASSLSLSLRLESVVPRVSCLLFCVFVLW